MLKIIYTKCYNALIFTLFFSLAFRTLIPFTIYFTFQEKIKETLCINLDKPEIMCNGKCFLAKQLNQVEDHQHSSNIQKNIQFGDVFIADEIDFFPHEQCKSIVKKQFTFWINNYFFQWKISLLKPPIV